jgi:predicted acetyltransferase
MGNIKLIEPAVILEKEYLTMIKEWHATGEKLEPFVLSYDCSNFPKFIQQINGFKNGIGIPNGWVPHSTFWLVNEHNQILGVTNIRHSLNDSLKLLGGHIGSGITPSQRRKGYGDEILKLSLQKAKELAIDIVLITCNKDNIASSRTIIKNGGKLWKEHVVNNTLVQNYWIE